MTDVAEMSDAELIAARDAAHAHCDADGKIEWSEFSRRTREWLRYRDECDRRGISRLAAPDPEPGSEMTDPFQHQLS